MTSTIERALMMRGFSAGGRDSFVHRGQINRWVRLQEGSLVFEVGIPVPFRDPNDPFEALLLKGELQDGGVQWETGIISAPFEARGQPTSGLAAFHEFGIPWLEKVQELSVIHSMIDQSVERRNTEVRKELRRRWLELVIPPPIKVGKPKPGNPPIYYFLKALLWFRGGEKALAVQAARTYCAMIDDADARRFLSGMEQWADGTKI